MKFYASIPGGYVNENLPEGDYLITAAQFWLNGKFKTPKFIPKRNFFIDCGAYSFKEKGFPYSWKQYLDFCSHWEAKHIALFDSPGDADKTLLLIQDNLAMIGDGGQEVFVPVVTGRTVEEYLDCFERLKELFFKTKFKPQIVAIGNLKKRTNANEIVSRLQSTNSDGFSFHLFGCSLLQLKSCFKIHGLEISSIDNGCWNGRFAHGISEFNLIMKEKNLSQQRTALDHFLPKYRNKVSKIIEKKNFEFLF
jgi:hypothetical protein